MLPLLDPLQTEHSTPLARLADNSSRQSGKQQERVTQPSAQLVQRVEQAPQQLGAGDVAYLQRAIGNRAVARLLKRSGADPAVPPLQAKLTVGPAHDHYEDEADRVAQDLSGAPVQRAPSSPAPTRDLQRAAGSQQQVPIGEAGGAVDAETSQTIRRAQGGGRAVDPKVRVPLEQTLNTDLSHARLHVNSQSDDLNQRVGARAFTTGADIFMQRSEYRPGSSAGRALLYHELTHVHQQTGKVRRAPLPRSRVKDQKVLNGSTGSDVAQHGVIQRAISKKSYKFSNIWNQMYDDQRPQSKQAKQDSENYLSSFDTKPTDKQGRKEQRDEEKEMKKLLHFGRKETKTSDKNRRLVFRSVLTAERARGQSMAAVAELKQFMLSQGDNINDGTYIGMLNGNVSNIKWIVGEAENAGASPNLLNLFHTHRPNPFANLDKQFNKLTPKINKVAPEAIKIGTTSDKSAVMRLPALVKQMLGLLASATQTRQRNEYVQFRQLVGDLSPLYETVWQLKTYGEMGAKSNLSSDKEIGNAKRLGGGQVNKVFEVNYDPLTNPSIQHGAFKQEAREYKAGDSPGAEASGIPENDANFGGRSVASYKIDKLLGTDVAPKTKFGTHQGVGGTVQDWAKGKSPQHLTDSGSTRYRDFDYSDPEIQRQLATLQIFDVITGQVDRHPGNYYIYQGPGGTQVTAIDNDLSFGKNKDVERMDDSVWNDGRKLAFDHSRGVPLFLDESIAEQILDTSTQDLKDVISGMLSDSEVNKTLARFARVKTELRRMKANTARIKTMQKKLDILLEYQGKFGSTYESVEDALGTQVDFLRRELVRAYGKGALLDRSEWGKVTAMHLTSENSYFGVLMEQAKMHRAQNKMIPVT